MTNGEGGHNGSSSSSTSDNHLLLEQRRALYPEVYTDVNELEQALQQYGVEVRWPPPTATEQQPSTRLSAVVAPTTGRNVPLPLLTPSTTTTRQTDIFGNIPGKEPAHLLECPVCSQKVNGLRFTSHLDKCMGIGTMSRSAAQHNTRK